MRRAFCCLYTSTQNSLAGGVTDSARQRSPGHLDYQERMMKHTMLCLSLLLAATIPVAVAAQDVPSNTDGSKMVRRMESRFDFTWDQRVQAKAILQQEQPVLEQLRTQLAAERAEMAEMTTYNDSQAR